MYKKIGNRLFLFFVIFYQRFVSPLTVGSCRYYPSCSEYSKWSFEHCDFFDALYKTILRILRCNKFFAGGIEYPTYKISKKEEEATYPGVYKKVSFWFVPIKNKKRIFYIIKSL